MQAEINSQNCFSFSPICHFSSISSKTIIMKWANCWLCNNAQLYPPPPPTVLSSPDVVWVPAAALGTSVAVFWSSYRCCARLGDLL